MYVKRYSHQQIYFSYADIRGGHTDPEKSTIFVFNQQGRWVRNMFDVFNVNKITLRLFVKKGEFDFTVSDNITCIRNQI